MRVPLDRFADRLDSATYADDDEVVGVFESDPSETDALWVSARLFRRLTGVARAYELHALPLLDDPEPVRLNRPRCEGVLDELAFVAERLADPLAVGMAQALTDYLAARVRRPTWDGHVTIEGDRRSVRSCRSQGNVPRRCSPVPPGHVPLEDRSIPTEVHPQSP